MISSSTNSHSHEVYPSGAGMLCASLPATVTILLNDSIGKTSNQVEPLAGEITVDESIPVSVVPTLVIVTTDL